MSLPSFHDIFQRLWRWAKFASGPTGATALLSLTTLAANVLIFRLLAQQQAGRFALLTALAQTLALLTGLGQGNLTRRMYSLQPLGHFNWPRDLAQTTLIVVPLAALASLVCNAVYGLSLNGLVFVFANIVTLILVTNLSQMLGSQRQYIAGSVLLRLPYNLLFLTLLPFAFIPAESQLNYLGVALVGCNLVTVGVGLFCLWRTTRPGSIAITTRDRVQGIAFMISGLAYQIPEEGLFSLAGTILAAPQLAAVAAFTLFLRPFGMLFDSLNQILLTELARRSQLRYRSMLAALAGLTAIAGVGALVGVPLAAHIFYNGRYDSYQYLSPILILGAALQLLEVLGRAHINARAPLRRVNLFVGVHTLVALGGAAFTLVLVKEWGVVGLALGTMGIYIVRNLVSYAFSWQLNRESLEGAAPLPAH